MIVGVDPGLKGALALYDYRTGALQCTDMPTWSYEIGNGMKSRVDPIALLEWFELAKLAGAELVVIEHVGGRPQQSASSGFTFGYAVGLVYMACVATHIAIETVNPTMWKKELHVPGKKNDPKNEGIMLRACEIFPNYRAEFHGKNGGKRVDRAEAAMLAHYGHKYVLPYYNKEVLPAWEDVLMANKLSP